MKTAAQYYLLLMVVMIAFRTLIVAEVRWDSKWSVICLLTWLLKILERQGRMDIGL